MNSLVLFLLITEGADAIFPFSRVSWTESYPSQTVYIENMDMWAIVSLYIHNNNYYYYFTAGGDQYAPIRDFSLYYYFS